METIRGCRSALVLTHLGPDGDGLGSQLALHRALKALGKRSTAVVSEPVPKKFHFLYAPGDLKIARGPSDIPKTDLILVLDTHEISRIDPVLFAGGRQLSPEKLAFIDHHTPEAHLPGPHCILPDRGSTGEVTFTLLERLGVPLSFETALPLYVAILTDTNAFRFARTSARTHQIAAKILNCGVEPERVFRELYAQDSEAKLRFLGYCLQHFEKDAGGRLAWLTLPLAERHRFGADIEDTESFLDRLMLLRDLEIGLLFREEPGGKIKVSFRSHAGVEVLGLAREFGGGGHLHAAGARIEGKMKAVVARVTTRARLALRTTKPHPRGRGKGR